MFGNFFKIAWRNIIRSKGFSVINITGLAVGMASAVLILLWIQDEVSFDNFHKNKDRIYEVWNQVSIEGKLNSWNTVPVPLSQAVTKDLPQVERAVKVGNASDLLLSAGDKKMIESGNIVDTGFLQVFTFPLLEGNPATALKDGHSIVLTSKMAKNLFGKEEAMGKIVRVNDKENYTVTGVVKDLPTNSRFNFGFLLPWSFIKFGEGQDLGWEDNSTSTYVLLKPNASIATANQKIKDLKQKYSDEARNMKWELFLYPMSRWRLYSSFTDGIEDSGGRSTFIKLFGLIAALILLVACINFMNLSTARSEKRAKEVGIRKVVGARKTSLVGQFMAESVFISLLSGIVAIVLVTISLPAYNQLTDKKLFVDPASGRTWLYFIGFILFTGLLAGSYPAFFLSSFKPVKVLKGTFKKANALITPRKILVVLQFTFAIVLIISTIVIKQQMDYGRERQTGYNRSNLIYHFMTGDIPKNFALIKNDLISTGVALSVTRTNSPLTERWSNGWGQNWEGKDPNANISFDRFLEGLVKTAGLQFVQGRDFDLQQFPTDSTGLIINESALKEMKFTSPLGKKVSDLGVEWHIVGVIKDFILTSPYEPMRPILICGAKSKFMQFYVVQIKLNESISTATCLTRIAEIFKKYNPSYPFDFKFVDQAYAQKFENEQLQETLAGLFSGLTIFISCLGLFGLATYIAENRTREIGVRKVLGASVTGIASLLSADFVKLVLLSFLVAAPLSYWAMHKWLQSYDYRVSIQWWVFAAVGFLSVLIAVVTVSSQAIRAALANPVKSLRSE